MADNQPISLGQLIDALSQCDQTRHVWFEFGYLRPADVASYRGYYDHLAIGFDENGSRTVAEFLAEMQSCVGKIFEGYKGASTA